MKVVWTACGFAGVIIVGSYLFAAILAVWATGNLSPEIVEAVMPPMLIGFSFALVAMLMGKWALEPKASRRKPHVRPHRGGF